jgi:branched-chain amino acid transport system permease protein
LVTVDFLINAISLGSLYAMIALGLVIVYGILKLVNFAYGELIMVAGYGLYLFSTLSLALPWFVMAILAVIMAVATSYLTELVAFRPVRAKSLTAMLITSFAVSTLLQNAALLIVSPRARAVPLPDIFSQSVAIGGLEVPWRNILSIVTALVLFAALTLLMRYTVLGIALRAAADDFKMTRLLGVPANLVISVAFIISGFFAGTVALFWTGRTASVIPSIGQAPLLVAFVACVIGGMTNLPGAVVGGYVYGLVYSLLSLWLPQYLLDYREAFMFMIVIVILVFRPSGLIRGGATPERVG